VEDAEFRHFVHGELRARMLGALRPRKLLAR
jgi:hypothetical protein